MSQLVNERRQRIKEFNLLQRWSQDLFVFYFFVFLNQEKIQEERQFLKASNGGLIYTSCQRKKNVGAKGDPPPSYHLLLFFGVHDAR